MKLKRQSLLEQHNHGTDNADGLRRHGSNRRTGGVQPKARHQHKVAHNVHNAGHQYKQQRRFAVAKAAEDGRQQIVGHDEKDTAAADAHIAGGQVNCLRRGLHQHRNRPRQRHHNDKQHRRNQRKHHRAAANDRPDVLRLFLAQIARNQHRDAHGKLRHHKGHKVQHLAAGGDSGKPRGGAEAPHNQQIHRAIGGLQHQRTQNRQHKKGELFQDAALCKIGIVTFHRNRSSRP